MLEQGNTGASTDVVFGHNAIVLEQRVKHLQPFHQDTLNGNKNEALMEEHSNTDTPSYRKVVIEECDA